MLYGVLGTSNHISFLLLLSLYIFLKLFLFYVVRPCFLGFAYHNKMETTNLNSMVMIDKFCSRCRRGVEYHCHTCQGDLCPQCKQIHDIDLNTKHHSIKRYRDKNMLLPKDETCSKHHTGCVYKSFCETCEVPVCLKGEDHTNHKILTFQTKLKQNQESISKIRSETIYKCQVLLHGLKPDVMICRKEIDVLKSSIQTKANRMKNAMNELFRNGSYFKQIHGKTCLSLMNKIKRYIGKIEIYEELHERFSNKPIKYLRFIAKIRSPKIQDTPNLPYHRLIFPSKVVTQEIIELLVDVQIIKKGKRQVTKQSLLTEFNFPVLKKSLTVPNIDRCLHHISPVTPDRVWVNDHANLILLDTITGDTLCHLKVYNQIDCMGLHTVNRDGELIYVDFYHTINKRFDDNRIETILTLINTPGSPWIYFCVYSSKLTGDLLVGMKRYGIGDSKVERYNSAWQLTQTIQHDSIGQALYKYPNYITENNNGDVVVSDRNNHSHGAVVVTSNDGMYRFSYTGYTSESKLSPGGVCTDAFSHILVCDLSSKLVHMNNENGQFLSAWYSTGINIIWPFVLGYDNEHHLLWVGSRNPIIAAYRYISRRNYLSGMSN